MGGFAAYWRMIYPGSSLIRCEWLRAIRLRAEGPASVIRPPGQRCAHHPQARTGLVQPLPESLK